MNERKIDSKTQDILVKAITSFALYGFPESHAASFALIAYASAYLKCHYLAAFTAAILNNQPMGFYSAATLVKDAQRHGLHFLPVDIACSVWDCSIQLHSGQRMLRLGFNYVKGLQKKVAEAIINERVKYPFESIDDLRRRVPMLLKSDLNRLADLGALNEIGNEKRNRRDALWQSELAFRPAGELLKGAHAAEAPSPLRPMDNTERLYADFRNSGLSIGPHPMRFHREYLKTLNVSSAAWLKNLRDGSKVRVAGAVICRQQPNTAKGFVFLSLEDETGIANAIISPALFAKLRVTVVSNPYLLVDGILQNERGVTSVKATGVSPCPVVPHAKVASHDFC